jgi:DnaK suppressor protein
MSTTQQQLKNLLEQLRDRLQVTANDESGGTEAVELDQAMVGRLSRMDAMQHQEMAKAQRRRAQSRLLRVQKCLDLYSNNDEAFGACGDCLEPIAWSRLNALPDAEFCVPCLEERNES